MEEMYYHRIFAVWFYRQPLNGYGFSGSISFTSHWDTSSKRSWM